MGVVYEARQEKPNRRVALKIVHPGFLTPALLRRFNLEVEILGQLEHPAIARIYGAGSTDLHGTALPYFAMEFVEGIPIATYVRQHNLALHDKIKLLKQVADGLHHAHQNGIIHRDIKPANVLIDKAGQPKILDFGVARATESDVRATVLPMDMGVLLGTLAYMAPEQASRNSAAVDIRADVYSLGMLAFEIITGQTPYKLDAKQIHDAIRIIQESNPPRMKSINRDLGGDLDIIVRKAIEKDKHRRYASAAALSDDLQHYLNNEPISARPPSSWYHFRTFARRHRSLVIAGFLFLFALILGFGLAVAALLRAREAEAKAQTAAQQAAREQKRAEDNLKRALDTVDQFTTHIAQRQFAGIPEASALREQLLRDAIAFYEQLAEDNQDNPEPLEELSWALTRMIEDNRSATNIEESQALAEQRIEQLTTLLKTDPANTGYLREMARSWSALGGIHQQAGRDALAVEALDRAISILRSQRDIEADDTPFQRDLVYNLSKKAEILAQGGNKDIALRSAVEATEVGTRLAKQMGNLESQRTAARSWMSLGNVQSRIGEKGAALSSYDRARTMYTDIHKQDPENPELRFDLARTLGAWGALASKTETSPEASNAIDEAGNLFQSLAEHYPNNFEYQRALARTRGEQGQIKSKLHTYNEAFSNHTAAASILRSLVETYPHNSALLRDLARSLADVGQSATAIHARHDAQRAFEEAYAIYEELMRDTPQNRDLHIDVAYLLGNWSLSLDSAEAKARLAQAESMWLDIIRQNPKNQNAPKALAWVRRQIATRENTPAQNPPTQRNKRDTIAHPPPASVSTQNTEAEKSPINLDASETEKIRNSAGQYATIRGRITSIAEEVGQNRLTFLRFGTEPLQFTALIHRNVLPDFVAVFGSRLRDLLGHELEINGLISVFRGTPQIALTRPDQIRLLQAQTTSKTPVLLTRSVDAILAREGQYVKVEGTVSLVNATPDRSITFIEFENKRRKKVTALVRADALASIEEHLGGPLSRILPGQRVQISGVPYTHRGNPNIDIRTSDQIEILPAPTE